MCGMRAAKHNHDKLEREIEGVGERIVLVSNLQCLRSRESGCLARAA